MVAIVDYGVGNLFSLRCSLEHIGEDCVVTGDEKTLLDAGRVILPGVGAFGDAAGRLREDGLDEVLRALVAKGTPLLGICLGMQLLFERSCEYGVHEGLGLLPGTIVPLGPDVLDNTCRVPQIGWNSLIVDDPHCPLLSGVKPGEAVYYVHSYYFPRAKCTAAWSAYGRAQVSGVVREGNVMGTQFHPEKSGVVGLSLLRAFCAL